MMDSTAFSSVYSQNLKSHIKKILLLSAIALPFVASIMEIPSTNALSIGSARDCDSNAVIRCGALSTTELQNKYSSNGSAQAIYSYFGISSSDINTLDNKAVAGEVTSSGLVRVDGKTVATDAVTAGRGYISGSTAVERNGVKFYVRPPRVSFVSSPLSAFVVMNGDRFNFAILASCGNPVTATAVAKPAPKPTVKKTTPPKVVTKVVEVPTPTPTAPAPQQQQQQQQTVVVQTTAQIPTAPAQQQQQQTGQQQQQPVASIAPAPTQIPNTGSGDLLGLGSFITLVSGTGHLLYRRRKHHSLKV